MNDIFSDKQALHAEYKRMFLLLLSDLELLKDCIQARYSKSSEPISSQTLEGLCGSNHSLIYAYIGDANASRIHRFFGNNNQNDIRDGQIEVRDRFLLDSINWYIVSFLTMEMEKLHQDDDEVSVDFDKPDAVHPGILRQRTLQKLLEDIFNDLIFPNNSSRISLFVLKGNRMILHEGVFQNWLPPLLPALNHSTFSSDSIFYALSAVAICSLIAPLIFNMGIIASVCSLILSLFVTTYLIISEPEVFEEPGLEKLQQEEPYKTSYLLMQETMQLSRQRFVVRAQQDQSPTPHQHRAVQLASRAASPPGEADQHTVDALHSPGAMGRAL